MKAMVCTQYGSPDVLQLQEVEKPVPKDDEVLIRIAATTVTAVDCTFREGDQFAARLFTGLIRPKQPILGADFAGEIEAVGKEVSLFKEGDQVFGGGSGTHAEYICLPEEGTLAIKPSTMTFEQAAAVPYGALTALPFLRRECRHNAGAIWQNLTNAGHRDRDVGMRQRLSARTLSCLTSSTFLYFRRGDADRSGSMAKGEYHLRAIQDYRSALAKQD